MYALIYVVVLLGCEGDAVLEVNVSVVKEEVIVSRGQTSCEELSSTAGQFVHRVKNTRKYTSGILNMRKIGVYLLVA